MGLDYSIEAKITNLKTNEHKQFEIAYWRKCWGLKDVLQKVANKYSINTIDDIEIDCNIEVISEVIDTLLETLKDINNNAWSNSFWGTLKTRTITVEELAKILVFDAWIKADNYEDFMEASETLAYKTGIDEDFLIKVKQNFFDYKIEIIFYNSY